MFNPFDKERMRLGADYVKATVQSRDYGNELALAVSFEDGGHRVRAGWPMSIDDAEKLLAELTRALVSVRRNGVGDILDSLAGQEEPI